MSIVTVPRALAVLTAIVLAAATLPASGQIAQSSSTDARSGSARLLKPSMAARTPNILFVMLDDVGIDQLSTLGYGGASPPLTPNINMIASAGVRFRSTWSMPECSNGRMALLTGRYPFRTNVYQAIGQNDLANSQASPYDITAARMLKQAGYKSALFGKYHLGGPDNNQFGNGGPGQLGWDYFYGWIGGLPASIDTTAGGVGATGTFACGYVPSTSRAINGEGANTGACYTRQAGGNTSCRIISGSSFGDSPGLTCLKDGGILVPNASCQSAPPANLNFQIQNAHYVSQVIINNADRVTELNIANPAGRHYRSSIEVNAAIDWINSQKDSRTPWMATLSFSADHTPIQTPPGHLLSQATRNRLAATMGPPGKLGTECGNDQVERILSDAMIEAMDTEFGRLLVSTGLARKRPDGRIAYDPARSNTMIVIVGDNGSFGDLVKTPFDPSRAKATAYQTGVWVPLIIAGPLVKSPNRDVPHMTNAVDIFGLFGEMAGLDPHKAAQPRTIDSVPMLDYLTNPGQRRIRNLNFTEGGLNIQLNGGHNPPCVVGATSTSPGACTQTPLDKSVCEANGGIYWGPGATDPSVIAQVDQCWQVNQAIYNSLTDTSSYDSVKVGQYPQLYYAARDATFKLVRSHWLDYDPNDPDEGTQQILDEFYEINESRNPLKLKIDRAGEEIYSQQNGVPIVNNLISVPGATSAYRRLSQYLTDLYKSSPSCAGDGNGDGVVNVRDLKDFNRLTQTWTGSSMFDFNYDGVTDSTDKDTITANIPTRCQ